jgi:ribosomal protein S14
MSIHIPRWMEQRKWGRAIWDWAGRALERIGLIDTEIAIRCQVCGREIEVFDGDTDESLRTRLAAHDRFFGCGGARCCHCGRD